MTADYEHADWRMLGCNDRCELRTYLLPGVLRRRTEPVHDPHAHERYGAKCAGNPQWDVIRTGPLVVDLTAATAMLSGRELMLSRREWLVLTTLAKARGGYVSTEDLSRALYPDERPTLQTRHAGRVWMVRVRAKLGDAASLLQTQLTRGYRLLMITPGSVLPPLQRPRWSRREDKCVRCHTTDRRHESHGLCTACSKSMQRVSRVSRDTTLRMPNGRYPTASERLALESGEWRVESGEQRTTPNSSLSTLHSTNEVRSTRDD